MFAYGDTVFQVTEEAIEYTQENPLKLDYEDLFISFGLSLAGKFTLVPIQDQHGDVEFKFKILNKYVNLQDTS